jgi:hypothetical protein
MFKSVKLKVLIYNFSNYKKETMSKKTISEIFLEEKKKLHTDIQLKQEKKERLDNTQIMREIEVKTEKKVMLILEKGNANDNNILQSVLSDGAKEFKEKTGRNMTYSEMREMFG